MDTISAYLSLDHEVCDDLFAQVEQHVDKQDWLQAVQHMRRFEGAMTRHIAMEEQVLFHAFEGKVGQLCYPIGALRAEHRQLELLIRRASGAVLGAAAIDFALHAETLCLLKQQHGAKEDAIFYPLLDQLLARERPALLARMREIREGRIRLAPAPAPADYAI